MDKNHTEHQRKNQLPTHDEVAERTALAQVYRVLLERRRRRLAAQAAHHNQVSESPAILATDMMEGEQSGANKIK